MELCSLEESKKSDDDIRDGEETPCTARARDEAPFIS